MTKLPIPHGVARAAALFGGALLVAAACTEPAVSKMATAPDPTLAAGLVLSDSAPSVGSSVEVYARVESAAPSVVGSFTARIRYDTTALRFLEEIAASDGGTRATNATAGLVRFAGAATSGMPGGHLGGYRFLVLRPQAVRTLQLVVDEIHTVARTDAATILHIVPSLTRAVP